MCVGGIRMSTIARSGRSSRNEVDQLGRVAGLAHDLEAGTLEQARETLAQENVVVRQHDPGGARAHTTIMGYRGAMGTSARLADPHAKDRCEPRRLAEEQAALRRVATLVARRAPAAEVFEAVAQEVAQVLHLRNARGLSLRRRRHDDDGSSRSSAIVRIRSSRNALAARRPVDVRRDPPHRAAGSESRSTQIFTGSLAAAARETGFNRVAGAPIIVDGRVWGVIRPRRRTRRSPTMSRTASRSSPSWWQPRSPTARPTRSSRGSRRSRRRCGGLRRWLRRARRRQRCSKP